MKKQKRTLIIVITAILVLTALLLGLLFLLPEDDDDSSSDTSDETINLIDKTKADDDETVDDPIKKIAIKLQAEEYEIVPGDDDQLVVAGYEDLPVNTTEIDSLVRSLSNVDANRKVADNSDNQKDFGLDKPRSIATVTYHDDSVVVFELGNEAAGDAGSYLRIQSDGPIYLVDSYFAGWLLKESVNYIGTTLITAPSAKSESDGDTAVLKDMKLSGSVRASKPFEFKVNQTDSKSLSTFAYITTKPFVKGASEEANKIAQAVTSLNAIQAVKAYPKSGDLKKYGLNNPYSVCEMTLAVQSMSSSDDDDDDSDTTVTTYYNSTKHKITLGSKDEDGNYYAMVDDIDAVYIVSPSAVPWADKQYGDIVTTMLFLQDITSVKSISLKSGGKTSFFELTHYPDEEDRDKSMVVKSGEKTYSTPDFRTLYQVYMMVYRHGELDKKPTGDADIVFTLQPIDKSADRVEARFYRQSASLYGCVLSDGDFYTVRASDIKKMLDQTENFLNGRKVSTE